MLIGTNHLVSACFLCFIHGIVRFLELRIKYSSCIVGCKGNIGPHFVNTDRSRYGNVHWLSVLHNFIDIIFNVPAKCFCHIDCLFGSVGYEYSYHFLTAHSETVICSVPCEIL